MKTKFSLILLTATVLLCSCATTPQGTNPLVDNATAFANSEAGRALTNAIVGASVSVIQNVGQQYATTGKVDSKKIVGAALDGSSASLRAIPNVEPFAYPRVAAKAVVDGANVAPVSDVVAPLVKSAISAEISKGTSTAQANENVATVLNIAATQASK